MGTARAKLLLLAPCVLLGCKAEVSGPTPEVDALDPSLVCGDQLTTEIRISGDQLSPLAIDEATDDPKLAIPSVVVRRTQDLAGEPVSDAAIELPNDPSDPASARVRWTSSSSMAFDVYPELGLAAGLYEVTVTNRNGETAVLPEAFAVVDEPTLDAIVPDLVCLEQGARGATLQGSGFLEVGDALPTVTFTLDGQSETYPVDELTGCVDLPGPTPARMCTTATVTLPEDGLALGASDVVVTNPAPAACDTGPGDDVTIAVVARPTLASAEPDLVCSEQGGATVTLTGTGFVVLHDAGGDIYPHVTLGGEVVPVASADGCTPGIDGTLLEASTCTILTVSVPDTLTITGDQPVVVTNPDPAGCHSEEAVDVLVLGAPAIATIEPEAVCADAQPAQMVVTGAGFVRLDDGAGGFVDPAVTVDGAAVAATFTGCTTLTSSVVSGEVCTGFTFPVPVGGYADGTHTVVVTNPTPADCTADATFTVSAAPTVTAVDPFKVCNEGGIVTVTGTGFVNGSEILLDGAPIPTTFVSETQVVGTVSGLPEAFYDVSVRNGTGCDSNVLTDAVKVVDRPIVFFVDPPNIYSEIDMRVTVWVSGIEGTSPTVSVRPTGTTVAPTALLDPAFDGDNRVFATVATSLDLAAGDYDVLVDDVCDAELADALHVTDTLTVHVSDVDPSFGVSSIDPVDDPTVESTGVAVFSDAATTPVGFANFVKAPRVYLNPVTSTAPATELKALQWLDDPHRIEGVVPAALPAGDYQIVVINPDGGVGVLSPKVFRVLPNDDQPPRITGLEPGQVVDTTGQRVDIVGEHFPTDLANVDVSAVCRDPSDPLAAEQTLTEANLKVAVTATSATRIDTAWDMSGLQGHACVVRVTNLANTAFSDFSAITITNSSGNLAPFVGSGRTMVEARRALSAATIRMNNTSRYLFAIGGDDGAATPVRRATVEAAPVDPFGTIVGDFTLQRNQLPAGRAFTSGAAAVVGRFVYIAGGRVGGGAGTVDDQVLRSYLLDPFEAPEITDLDFTVVEGSAGLDPGVWYYKVAAIMDVNDPNNPGGEGLPSEPLVVQVPALTNGVHLTLYWEHVPGAVAYRIYRTPVADAIAGDEVLLGTQATTLSNGVPAAVQAFTDTGLDNTAATETPMPLGSLGVWHQVGTLTTAREGAALVAVPDPTDTTGTRHFLYVIGGRAAGGTVLASIEWAQVDAVLPNVQAVGAFAVSAAVLPSGGARWLLGAVYLDARKSTAITGSDVYVYALPGENAATGNNAVNRVTALEVDVGDGAPDADGVDGDGSLSGAVDVASPNAKYTGYGYVANHGFLQIMGGRTGAPSATGDETFVTTAPALDPWDAGTTLDEARHLCGTGYESAFIYLLGGTTTVPASNTVEQSNF